MAETVPGMVTADALLAEAAAVLAATIGTASTMRLYKAGEPVGPTASYADFVAAECDFSGYASVALTFTGPFLDAGGNAVLPSNDAVFSCDDTVTFNTVGGIWVEENEGGSPAVHKVVGVYPFNVPVNINNVGAFIASTLFLKFPGLAGECVVES